MAEASIPVNLLNPGQVFACLGFLEAADVLVGSAEGGFDWTNETEVEGCFRLRAAGSDNPFGVVLGFLAEAEIQRCAPIGYSESPKSEEKNGDEEDEAHEDPAGDGPLGMSETFPAREAKATILPVRLQHQGRYLDVGHWADDSSRKHFRLFAGRLRGPAIARAMLSSITDQWRERSAELTSDPFNILSPMGGSSFKFDARKAWTGLGAGYSPDEQGHGVAASPVVEILAAVGLEHARPDEYDTRQVRFGAWGGHLPPVLARPAIAGALVGVPLRVFRFALELSGKNKIVTFAQEVTGS